MSSSLAQTVKSIAPHVVAETLGYAFLQAGFRFKDGKRQSVIFHRWSGDPWCVARPLTFSQFLKEGERSLHLGPPETGGFAFIEGTTCPAPVGVFIFDPFDQDVVERELRKKLGILVELHKSYYTDLTEGEAW